MATDNATHTHSPTTQVLDMNERTWLARYCRGETACFELLVDAYKKPIYSYLVRSGFDRCTCDDLFQEIFMKIHQYADSYQATKPLKPWIFTIAVNTVRNFKRDHPAQAEHSEQLDAINDPSPKPESVISLRQTLNSLELAIAGLPSIQSEVVQLALIDELPQKEVAAILQIPVNSVKTHLRRARETLLKNYLSTGGCNEDL